MKCPFCSVQISEDDYRCANCGRRLSGGVGTLSDLSRATRSATALKLETVAYVEGPQETPAGLRLETSNGDAPAGLPRHASSLQSSLFALREATKLASIDGLMDSPADAPRRRAPRRPNALHTAFIPDQGVLEFVPPPGPAPRMLPTSVEAAIYCDYPVANRTHRMIAGALDLAIVIGCMSLFLAVLYFGCEGLSWLELSPVSATCIAIATGLLGFLYEAYWIATGVPSPGMDLAGLRIVHFDGHEPSPADCRKRILGGIVSMMSGFLGMAWAFVDEECLTWQDHISRTFPTPIRHQGSPRR